MLPKRERMSRKDHKKLFSKKKSLILLPFLANIQWDDSLPTSKISIVVPKSTAIRAVDRNRIRRQIYGIIKILKQNKAENKKFLLLITCKKKSPREEYVSVLTELFKKLDIFQ